MGDSETMDYDGNEEAGGGGAPVGGGGEEYEEDGGFENDIDMDEDYANRGRGRGAFRGWNGPGPRGDGPPRFRGRGYGPGGPPNFRGRGGPPPMFGRGGGGGGGSGPRNGNFNAPPNFNSGQNWCPPPGQLNAPPMMQGNTGPYGPPGLLGGPPNMAGGPPPLMGAPGQFQNNIDMNQEIWVETKANEGKVYYYNARTRETTWNKPDGANIKIILQDQVEAMAQAAQLAPGTTTAAQAALAQANITNKQEGEEDPNNDNKNANNMQATLMQGPPPGMGRFPGPGPGQFGGAGGVGVGGGAGGVAGAGPPFGLPPPGFQGNWATGGPGGGWCPPNHPGAVGGGAPPWGAMPPTMMGPGGLIPPPQLSAIDEAAVMAKIDPDIIAKAADWSEHKSPDGRFYYYNAKKGESVWEKPQELKDLETKLAAAQGISTRPLLDGVMGMGMGEDIAGKQEQVNGGIGGGENDDNVGGAGGGGVGGKDGLLIDDDKRKKMDDDAAKRKKQEEEEKAKELKAQDKSRPVSSTPVPGTPWCVVWTGDGRVFFYNPSSRTSVWERPDDLIGRSDVDKMVANPPDAISGSNAPSVQAKEPQSASTAALSVTTPSKTSAKRTGGVGSDESESEEEDDVPNKKQKIDETNSTSNGQGQTKEPTQQQQQQQTSNKKIDIGKEAAMEAEVRAAKERAIIPLETRIKSFKEMLAEKEVSAFSTWEKELHKIVFDHRYLLLTSKERKQVFEKYVKERAEDERREKRNKLRERKDAFRKLLTEAHLHGKSSFSDFAQKYAKDERFKGVEKMRERESLFNEYLIDVRRREKEEKSQRREQIKKDFMQMVRENNEIDRHARWSDVRKLFSSDARYKAVDSSGQREDWFREHCKILKDEKKKAKEKEREHKKERGDKEKHKKSSKEHREEKRSSRNSKTNDDSTNNRKEGGDTGDDLITASIDQNTDDQDETAERNDDVTAAASTAIGSGDDKDDEQANDSANVANSEQADHSITDDEKALELKEKDRQARAEASLREREKEVQRTLATHMRDRDKEREQHKRDESIQHFNALLADLVRNADLGWRDVKRILRKDHRWDLASSLPRDEKEKLFNDHIEGILRKKREKFRELLDETAEVNLTSTWKEIKKLIKEDPRYTKFATSERCEREFKDYLKDKLIMAKGQFKELLQETKLITHKSLQTLRENQGHMTEIEDILKNDKRYLVLDFIPQERTQLILNYLEELDRRGPPPPPTASEPSRRSVK